MNCLVFYIFQIGKNTYSPSRLVVSFNHASNVAVSLSGCTDQIFFVKEEKGRKKDVNPDTFKIHHLDARRKTVTKKCLLG